jgi:hypothetical protein
MNWNEAISEAKDCRGYGYGYLEPHEWDEVVECAKLIISEYYKEEGEDNKAFYYAYINSPGWADKRYTILKSCHYTCRDCGGKAIQVHHTSYANLQTPKEILDCIPLCVFCHQARHGLVDKNNIHKKSTPKKLSEFGVWDNNTHTNERSE